MWHNNVNQNENKEKQKSTCSEFWKKNSREKFVNRNLKFLVTAELHQCSFSYKLWTCKFSAFSLFLKEIKSHDFWRIHIELQMLIQKFKCLAFGANLIAMAAMQLSIHVHIIWIEGDIAKNWGRHSQKESKSCVYASRGFKSSD